MRSGVSSVKTTFSTAGGLSSPVSALAVGVLACALAVAALAYRLPPAKSLLCKVRTAL
jgi:hypothetical protein